MRILTNDPDLAEVEIPLSGQGLEAPIAPTISAWGGVVNAASFGATIAPGAILSLFGQNLAEVDAIGGFIPLPTELSGTRIEIIDSNEVARLGGLFGIFNDGK